MALESSKEDTVRLLFSKYEIRSYGKSEITRFFFIAPNYYLLGGKIGRLYICIKHIKIFLWLTLQEECKTC